MGLKVPTEIANEADRSLIGHCERQHRAECEVLKKKKSIYFSRSLEEPLATSLITIKKPRSKQHKGLNLLSGCFTFFFLIEICSLLIIYLVFNNY